MTDRTRDTYFQSSDVTIWNADARDAWKWLPENAVDAVVTSPPYWGLRDYGVDGQLGLEEQSEAYVDDLADLLTGYARVLKDGGSLWLNLGDTYGPDKCLSFIPERVAWALIDRDWIVRNKVVWAKPNGIPESVQDRLATKWEHVLHLVRSPQYHYDLDSIREPHKPHPRNRGRVSDSRTKYASKAARMAQRTGWNGDAHPDPKGVNPGDVWHIPTQPYPEAHFAVFPEELIRRPILATVPEGGVVLDPFFGSGTTGIMARRLGRKAWGIELNLDYCELAASRFTQEVLPLEAS